jgi:nicotinamide-nucleotide amidase
MFSDADIAHAAFLLDRLRRRRFLIATAESCTGGLIVGLLTEIPGSSDVVERGFITYSNGAKCDLLGVPATLIGRYGAVSAEVAVAMATGAVRAAPVDIAIAVTGVAGPGGGSAEKPVGLVHLSAVVKGQSPQTRVLHLGNQSRSTIRLETVREALKLCHQALDSVPDATAAIGSP